MARRGLARNRVDEPLPPAVKLNGPDEYGWFTYEVGRYTVRTNNTAYGVRVTKTGTRVWPSQRFRECVAAVQRL